MKNGTGSRGRKSRLGIAARALEMANDNGSETWAHIIDYACSDILAETSPGHLVGKIAHLRSQLDGWVSAISRGECE